MNLNDLRDEVYTDAVAHGLWEDEDRFAEELAMDETTPEKQEEMRTFSRRRGAAEKVFFEAEEVLTAAEDENWEGVKEELADTIIMALSAAGYLGIDIDKAVRDKMEINKGRSWKHEGEKHE